MAYGWCEAHRVYGFSGSLNQDILELSEKLMEKMGVECFVESVYKCQPCGLVYGVSIDAAGDAPEEVVVRLNRAVEYVNKKYGMSLECGYWLCVNTDMTDLEMDGSEDSSDSSEGTSDSEA